MASPKTPVLLLGRAAPRMVRPSGVRVMPLMTFVKPSSSTSDRALGMTQSWLVTIVIVWCVNNYTRLKYERPAFSAPTNLVKKCYVLSIF